MLCWRVYLIETCFCIRAAVLFLVHAVERNVFDQRFLEYNIYENHLAVKVLRRTLQQIRTGGFLSPDRKLIVLVLFSYSFFYLSDIFFTMFKSLFEIYKRAAAEVSHL